MFVEHDIIEVIDYPDQAGPESDADAGQPDLAECKVVQRLRIVWADLPSGLFAYVDTAQVKTDPVLYEFAEGENLIEAGIWRIVEGFAPVYPSDTDVPENHRNKRDADWELIAGVVNQIPAVFDRMSRARMVADAAQLHDTTTITIRKHLRRYFHGGSHRDALIPAYANVGNPGKSRPGRNDGPKVGRPAKYGDEIGVNITPEIKHCFMLAADKHTKNYKLNLLNAYHWCMRTFYSVETDKIRAGRKVRLPVAEFEKAGLPRYEQFLYHVNLNRSQRRAVRSRLGERKWALTKRPLINDLTGEAWGPASRYQIDATVLDLYAVSRLDRNRIIGRPTLYVVIDVFSRMIVGFAISFDPPSWQAAMTALANAFSDKVEFCAKYGVTITKDEWPCNHLCAILEGDRGEILSAKIENLTKLVTIENASAWRADWKGIVESRFKILQEPFRPFVPGYVEPDFNERGTRDYRLDAMLNVDDIMKTMILLILHFNNEHELQGYPKLPAMTADGVAAVPLELWDWGIANGGGRPRNIPEDVAHFKLLPRQNASVNRHGIYYNGNYYTCPKAIEEGWFENGSRVKQKVISPDKRYTDAIFVHDSAEPNGFLVAKLTPTSRRHRGSNGWEMHGQTMANKAISAGRRTKQTLARAGMDGGIEDIVDTARTDAGKQVATQSAAERVKDLRSAKAAEVAIDRVQDSAEYREKLTGKSAPSDSSAAVSDTKVVNIDGKPHDQASAQPSTRTMMNKYRKGQSS